MRYATTRSLGRALSRRARPMLALALRPVSRSCAMILRWSFPGTWTAPCLSANASKGATSPAVRLASSPQLRAFRTSLASAIRSCRPSTVLMALVRRSDRSSRAVEPVDDRPDDSRTPQKGCDGFALVQWLVDGHRLHRGAIKAGEPHVPDDDQLQRILCPLGRQVASRLSTDVGLPERANRAGKVRACRWHDPSLPNLRDAAF